MVGPFAIRGQKLVQDGKDGMTVHCSGECELDSAMVKIRSEAFTFDQETGQVSAEGGVSVTFVGAGKDAKPL